MWEQARATVEAVFFKDKFELIENSPVEDTIGEEINVPVSKGFFSCNVEDNSTTQTDAEAGVSKPQTIRISTSKAITLSNSFTYKVKVVSARLKISSDDTWKVVSKVEGQISTVLIAQREVSI